MHTIELTSKITVYENRTELSSEILALLVEAEKAAERAYAPYSNFQVGAAILLNNGKVIAGNNQENAVYPTGLCAERTTAFYASSQYPDVPFSKIAVTAINKKSPLTQPVSPCGSCRQALYEYEQKFNQPIEVILAGESGPIYVLNCIADLLPYTFHAGFLQ